MSNPLIVVLVTIWLVTLSAFFVAVQFALIGARRHRLEDAAAGSRSAAAALRSASELPVLLAGSQLGITVCTLALGAITKPAVHHWITPVLDHWGAPHWLADVLGFILALLIVTFVHLVVGEMAPKSWAIAHPEKSAILLALPMRGFMWLTRPLLEALNRLANGILRKLGVEAVDQVGAGQDSEALAHLVEHSADVGTLDERYHTHLASALELSKLTVRDVLPPGAALTSVRPDATAAEIRDMSRQTGFRRILVRANGLVDGVVHVRDAVSVDDQVRAADIMRPVLALDAASPVYEALQKMRDTRSHVATVTDGDVSIGMLSINDVLQRLLATTD